MQKRRNSSALAMELRLFCIKPLYMHYSYVCLALAQRLLNSHGRLGHVT